MDERVFIISETLPYKINLQPLSHGQAELTSNSESHEEGSDSSSTNEEVSGEGMESKENKSYSSDSVLSFLDARNFFQRLSMSSHTANPYPHSLFQSLVAAPVRIHL